MHNMTAKMSDFNWEGVFRDFLSAHGDQGVFEDDIWLQKVEDRAPALLRDAVGGAIPAVATTTEYALPFVTAFAASGKQRLRILDFCGGLATSYVPLRAMLPSGRDIEFVVVENEAVCRVGKNLFGRDRSVRFVEAMPRPPEQFDIVHYGSSLHYIDDWRGALAGAAALSPEYLIFVDLPAADNLSFVTTQRFHGRRIPVHFWNGKEFIEHVGQLGFELLMKSRYRGYYLVPGRELQTGNFDADHRLTYVSQLVFRRADTSNN